MIINETDSYLDQMKSIGVKNSGDFAERWRRLSFLGEEYLTV